MRKHWLTDAKKQLRVGHLQQAYDLALGRLSENRSDADAWGIMSLVALEGGNPVKSLELSEKSIGFGSSQVWILAGRGRALLTAGRQDEARDMAQSVALENCSDALEADTIGVILARTGLHEQAVPFFNFATDKDNKNAQFHYNLATSLQFIGELKEAASTYRSVLAMDPAFHRARLALVQLEPQGDEDLVRIERLFANHHEDADSALQLGHAAAKIHESRGEHQKSLNWLHEAKRLKHQQVSHERDWVNALFKAANTHTVDISDTKAQAAETPRHVPVFIVGMPRSGTTLIERIISSHSAVATAGELPDLALLAKRSSKTVGPHTLSPELLKAPYDPGFVGKNYLMRTQTLTESNQCLIDKMPFNFFFAAHILESMPGARIVMVRRDPRDTVFANYRQLFATDFGYYNYAYDLEDTAHFVAHFVRLADHWRSILPASHYHEIHYEDVISNQESESRRLIDFLGLDWEGACLNFHKNAAPVATASSVQVRAPIHSKSVGQWKRYGESGELVNAALQKFAEE
ncbi:sulfotransferase [Sphingorhabdus sp. Alg239-R122]|uniref:tetratricopeptide repeat-containing sulfotransferase family protein n=1 Tax=Sphingorhabdus sp. Alg239-R122 TaxID=2305989 RepID=UPI0013DC96B3|nr:sulfotransferase [Sphingorhabdus sp. Alg239-R122]